MIRAVYEWNGCDPCQQRGDERSTYLRHRLSNVVKFVLNCFAGVFQRMHPHQSFRGRRTTLFIIQSESVIKGGKSGIDEKDESVVRV